MTDRPESPFSGVMAILIFALDRAENELLSINSNPGTRAGVVRLIQDARSSYDDESERRIRELENEIASLHERYYGLLQVGKAPRRVLND